MQGDAAGGTGGRGGGRVVGGTGRGRCGSSVGGARRWYKTADFEELNTVSSFRVSELQMLLGFAGRNKGGRKHGLLMRALQLLKSGCSPVVQIKIRELYRRRYPWTLEGLSDLSTIKSLVFSLDGSSSPVEPDLAAAGTHSWPSTSVIPHSPFSPAGSVLLQDTNPTLETQQPSRPILPVQHDVRKNKQTNKQKLPFYEAPDVLIKPTSLVQSNVQQFQEKFLFLLGHLKLETDAYPEIFCQVVGEIIRYKFS